MGVGKPCAAQSKIATPSTCAVDLNPVIDLSLAVGATLVLGSRREMNPWVLFVRVGNMGTNFLRFVKRHTFGSIRGLC